MRKSYSYTFMLISVGAISFLINDPAIAGSNNRGVMLAVKQSLLNATSTQKRRYTPVRRQQGRVVLDTKTPEPAKAPVSGVNKAQNPRASFGGAKAETIKKPERRLPATLRHRNRAVSKEDYKKIGNKSPGGTVHRARVKPQK